MAKICVAIGRGRHSAMLEEWKAAAEAGAELVELRLDCLRREPDLKRLLVERFTPAVVTMRRAADGGLYRGDDEKRLRILREAIVAGIDYVDLEADIAPSVPRFGKTKRIVSVHNFKTIPEADELAAIAKDLAAKNADVVKIAGMAHSVAAAARMLELTRDAAQPTVAIAMGPLGFFTRILGAKFGSPFTYANFNPERTFAPGMPSQKDLARDYCYDRINAETEVYAVVGDPIAHTLSPAIHNPSFRHAGLNKVMVPIQVPADRLKEDLEVLEFLNLRGVSVTIPHKEAARALLSSQDKAVELTGACNTLVRDENNKWIGHNTDYRAAVDSLERALGGVLEGNVSPLMDKQVIVIGAGGAARAVAFGVARRGAIVTIVNRSEERGLHLAEEVGCRTTSWDQRGTTHCDIMINCTPIGMHPEVDDSPAPPGTFKPKMVAFDCVYHPEQTLFLKQAREHECTVVTGVDMFVRQAAVQFEYYTGKPAPSELMRQIIKSKFSPLKEG